MSFRRESDKLTGSSLGTRTRRGNGAARQAARGPVVESYRAGAAPLRNALQAGDLPDPAAALVGPPKPVVLQHHKHRARWVGEAPKAALGQPHHQVEHPVERAGERVAGWIAEDQGAPRMVGGSSQQALVVWVTAHYPVQDHQVGWLHRRGVLGEIVDAPVDAPLDPYLPDERARLFLVGGGEFQILGPRRARLQQLDLDLADAPADLQDAGTLDAELA